MTDLISRVPSALTAAISGVSASVLTLAALSYLDSDRPLSDPIDWTAPCETAAPLVLQLPISGSTSAPSVGRLSTVFGGSLDQMSRYRAFRASPDYTPDAGEEFLMSHISALQDEIKLAVVAGGLSCEK